MVRTFIRRGIGLVLCEIHERIHHELWEKVLSNQTIGPPISHVQAQMEDDLKW